VAGNNRAFHFGKVIAEADSIDHRPGPFIILGIEGIDVADAAAHEQKNH
jgi:hypothetical protein